MEDCLSAALAEHVPEGGESRNCSQSRRLFAGTSFAATDWRSVSLRVSGKKHFAYCYDQCQYFSQSSLPGFFILNGVSFRNYLLPTMLLPNISLVPAQGKTLPKESLQLSRKRFSSRIKQGNVTVITFPCFSRTMSDADNLLFMLFHNLLLRNEGKRRRAYFGTTLVVQ